MITSQCAGGRACVKCRTWCAYRYPGSGDIAHAHSSIHSLWPAFTPLVSASLQGPPCVLPPSTTHQLTYPDACTVGRALERRHARASLWRLVRRAWSLAWFPEGRACSGSQVEALLGHFTHVAMFQRGLLPIVKSAYVFVRDSFFEKKTKALPSTSYQPHATCGGTTPWMPHPPPTACR